MLTVGRLKRGHNASRKDEYLLNARRCGLMHDSMGALAPAIETIIKKARAAGITVGVGLGPEAEAAITMAKRGVHWMQLGADVHYLWRYYDQLASAVRDRIG